MNAVMASTAGLLVSLDDRAGGTSAPGERTGDASARTLASEHDINVLRNRIAKAESDRDAARGAGLQERYVAAYVLVEALELELDQRVLHSQR